MSNSRRFAAALTIILSTSATAASSQAFGIEMGMPLENMEVLSETNDFKYKISVPKPHPEFESYTLITTPETGACKVSGIGKDHDNDKFGSSVQKSFLNLRDALETRYGKHEFFDFIRVGGIWDGNDEWVMSIKQNERIYSAYWDEEEKSNMPEGLSAIGLHVRALSSDLAYIVLSYDFDNIEECYRIRNEADTDGL